jgi:hypothetical protein
MAEFILTHRFPNNFQGAPDTAAAAKAYFDQIASVTVTRTDGTVETRELGDCGSSTHPNAYTIVNAENMEAAVAIGSGWPLLKRGAGLEVRQLTTKPFDLNVRPAPRGSQAPVLP